MTNEELIRLQNTQFEILKAVTKICNQENITYYLAYGTLLGAIRHGESIPWDYDIDIFMDCENFKKFSSFAGRLPEIYELKVLGGKWGGLSRIYKKGTLVYEPDHGEEGAFPIHIDIFLLEYAKDSGKLGRRCATALAKYLMVAKLSPYEKRFHNQPLKKWICRSGDFLKCVASEEKIEKWARKLVISDIKSEFYTSLQDLGKLYPVACFGTGTLAQYEDMQCTVPEKSHELLTLMYGDYMQVPPVEDRFTSQMDNLVIRF